MQELTQHLLLHPYLAALAAVLLVAVIVTELRNRGQGSGGVSPTQTIQLMNKGALVIDVRANDAYAAGHIGDARNIVPPNWRHRRSPEALSRKTGRGLLRHRRDFRRRGAAACDARLHAGRESARRPQCVATGEPAAHQGRQMNAGPSGAEILVIRRAGARLHAREGAARSQGFHYRELNVEDDPVLREEMVKRSGRAPCRRYSSAKRMSAASMSCMRSTAPAASIRS